MSHISSETGAVWVPHPVTDYRSAASSGDPLVYPGERPSDSYVTDGATVSQITVSPNLDRMPDLAVVTEDGEVALDEHLHDSGVDLSGERVAMLAYGANASPASLAAKFSKGGDMRPDLLVVPTVYAAMPGHDVVWSAGPGMNGNFIANLYRGEEVADTNVQVGINLLTPEQVLMMHSTELAYDLQEVEVVVGGYAMAVYMYAGKDHIHTDQDTSSPVAIASIDAENRRLTARTTKEMLDSVLGIASVRSALASRHGIEEDEICEASQYIALVKSLKKNPESQTPRMDLKRFMAGMLAEAGLSRLVDLLADGDGQKSLDWDHPTTLRRFGDGNVALPRQRPLLQPDEILPEAGWSGEQAEAARGKIIRSLAIHAERMRAYNLT